MFTASTKSEGPRKPLVRGEISALKRFCRITDSAKELNSSVRKLAFRRGRKAKRSISSEATAAATMPPARRGSRRPRA